MVTVGRKEQACQSSEPVEVARATPSGEQLVPAEQGAVDPVAVEPTVAPDQVAQATSPGAVPPSPHEVAGCPPVESASGESEPGVPGDLQLYTVQIRAMTEVSGAGLRELAARQASWLREQAGEEGLGRFLTRLTERLQVGNPGAATTWQALLPGAQEAWRTRFATAVDRVRSEDPDEVRAALQRAEEEGGGIRFVPDYIEERGVKGIRKGNEMMVGTRWVELAEASPSWVYAAIAHELGAHVDYESRASWAMMEPLVDSLSAEEQAEAPSRSKLRKAFTYMEEEIYAELRELPHHQTEKHRASCLADVRAKATRILEMYEPTVARAVLLGLQARLEADPRITTDSRRVFAETIAALLAPAT